jgi:hypothetical protein
MHGCGWHWHQAVLNSMDGGNPQARISEVLHAAVRLRGVVCDHMPRGIKLGSCYNFIAGVSARLRICVTVLLTSHCTPTAWIERLLRNLSLCRLLRYATLRNSMSQDAVSRTLPVR